MSAGTRADTANAVETAIERSKRDEKLTWADLVADKQTFRNDHPVRPNSADKLAEAARIRNK